MTNREQFMAESIEYAKKQLVTTGMLVPMFIARSGVNKTWVMVTPWENENEKNLILNYLSLLFIAEDIEEYIFMSEMWFKKLKSFNAEDMPKGFVADEPDKQEGLMIVQVAIENDTLYHNAKMFETHRNGKKVELTEMPHGSGSGRFTDLLSPKKHSHETIAVVKKMIMEIEKIIKFKPTPFNSVIH